MIDEDPSPEDVARFDSDTAYCPKCGAEIWDEADVCPKCHEYISGNTSARSPVQHFVNQKSIAVIVILILIGLLLWWVF